MKGCYILIVNMYGDNAINVGSLGRLSFQDGNYAYVESAMNGLEQRIGRHMRKKKAIRWHIDYILQYGNIVSVFIKENDTREECEVSKALALRFRPIRGFGSSDCNCRGHLYRIDGLEDFKRIVHGMGFHTYLSGDD